jgi:hypothetical protein
MERNGLLEQRTLSKIWAELSLVVVEKQKKINLKLIDFESSIYPEKKNLSMLTFKPQTHNINFVTHSLLQRICSFHFFFLKGPNALNEKWLQHSQ